MLYAFVVVIIVVIFRNWFGFLPVSSGDTSFFFKEQIIGYFNPPFMWEAFRNLGFGGPAFISQGVYFYNVPLGILGHVLDYGVIERIIWFFPILLLGFVSPIILAKTLKLFDSKLYPLTALIFLLNTYFLIIISGGQFTVAFGYIAIPLVFAAYLSAVRDITFIKIILSGFLFSVLVSFDFRFTYIYLVVLFLYIFFSCLTKTSLSVISFAKRNIIIFFSMFIITLGVQAYWLLPFLPFRSNPIASASSAYTTADAVKYFSFAQLESSFSLLHPLWPENIFGKVGFMKPEFLLMPILAYSSLLFLNSKFKIPASPASTRGVQRGEQNSKLQLKSQNFNNKTVLFFAFLGLIGAFLAKGANDPFGSVYVFLFEHVPGFVMFRDPTKWYTLVALSYSILIPFSIWKIYEWLKSCRKFSIKSEIFNLQNSFLILMVSYLLFLINSAILGNLGGMLKPVDVPEEYIELKNFLVARNDFFRVLWVPTLQRFTFYSNIHPAISGRDYFNAYDKYGVVNLFKKSNQKELLQKSAIKYVIVPDDTQKEIYIKDRKYDPVEHNVTVEEFKKIPWLKYISNFGKITVFEVENPKDHFWSDSADLKIKYSVVDPTKYYVQVKNAKINDKIIFTESFDKNWIAKMDNGIINSKPFDRKFNSFALPKQGNYTFEVYYKPQELVKISSFISLFSLLSVLVLMIFSGIRGKIAGKL